MSDDESRPSSGLGEADDAGSDTSGVRVTGSDPVIGSESVSDSYLITFLIRVHWPFWSVLGVGIRIRIQILKNKQSVKWPINID